MYVGVRFLVYVLMCRVHLVVKYLIGRSALVSYLEQEVNIESDCEGDSPETNEETHNAKEEKDEQERVRAVLITGSFSAYALFLNRFFYLGGNDELFSWGSLFFYRCTDEILFAPLKSQGVDSRLKYIRDKTEAAAPPPCSPKSIYVLANLVGLLPTKHLTAGVDPSF